METRIAEIADGIYRLSTFVPEIAPPAGFTFNQFLVLGDEPLLFQLGCGACSRWCGGPGPHHPAGAAALDRLRPLRGRQCGAMNEWLAVAPRARGGARADRLPRSLNDMADRAPRISRGE